MVTAVPHPDPSDVGAAPSVVYAGYAPGTTRWPVAVPRVDSLDWRLSLPLSPRLTAVLQRAEVLALSEALLDLLGLEGKVAVIEADVEVAVNVEAHFRRRWWAGVADPFREAVHTCKFQAHAESGTSAAMTDAWRQMSEQVRSATWRAHLRRLTAAGTRAQARALRLLFGAAAQLWTRAARWDAALAPRPNPFARIIGLLERACWPVGWEDATLYVCQIQPQAAPNGEPLFPEFRQPADVPDRPLIFLSAPFRERFTEQVLGELARRGWPVVHGRVDERIPPERQLGGRIMNASMAVGTLIHPDTDFGMPWWTFQELDFARACGRPVALLVGGARDDHHDPFETFTVIGETITEGFWRWLQSQSPAR